MKEVCSRLMGPEGCKARLGAAGHSWESRRVEAREVPNTLLGALKPLQLGTTRPQVPLVENPKLAMSAAEARGSPRVSTDPRATDWSPGPAGRTLLVTAERCQP